MRGAHLLAAWFLWYAVGSNVPSEMVHGGCPSYVAEVLRESRPCKNWNAWTHFFPPIVIGPFATEAQCLTAQAELWYQREQNWRHKQRTEAFATVSCTTKLDVLEFRR